MNGFTEALMTGERRDSETLDEGGSNSYYNSHYVAWIRPRYIRKAPSEPSRVHEATPATFEYSFQSHHGNSCKLMSLGFQVGFSSIQTRSITS